MPQTPTHRYGTIFVNLETHRVVDLMVQLYELALSFLTLVRKRRGEDLEAWRTQATASEIEPLARFAEGLQDDLTAVQAGLTLPWSNSVASSSQLPPPNA